jgi:hypothetical protein
VFAEEGKKNNKFNKEETCSEANFMTLQLISGLLKKSEVRFKQLIRATQSVVRSHFTLQRQL